jgi:hypothetical protein
MSGIGGDTLATWVAAAATLIVLAGLLGERRVFGWSQHLLAGLATGFLALIAIREVIVPRLVVPLAGDPGGRLELWLGLGLVTTAAAAPWLPRVVAAVPISIAIGSLAAFALGGAVVGTIIPQLADAVAQRHPDPLATIASLAAAAVTGLVLVGFVRGAPRGRIVGAMGQAGRWAMLAGIGGWLGYLMLSRLVLLLDRLVFLLRDWLGIVA